MHKFLFYNKFIVSLYMFRALLCSSSGGHIVLYSIWYRHTETIICRVIQKDELNWRVNGASTHARRLWYSRFSALSTGWLARATLKIPLNSSHILLWYTWSAGAFASTQTAYLLKLVIPTTNAVPRCRLNVETKTKRTLHSSRRLSLNELTKANLVLHSSHFALNWRCCRAVRYCV